jgi:predicted lipoprotein with Yx(FWY)xxD motif
VSSFPEGVGELQGGPGTILVDGDGRTLYAFTKDNGDQSAYGGKPLYYFAGDAKPGDSNGQGVGNVWFAVTADGQLVTERAAGGRYP